VRFPRNQRTYFDVLPQVHVSYGKYVEVPLHRPLDDNALGVEKLWEWRAERYPQFNPSDTKIGMSTTMSSTYDPGGSAMTTARDGQKWVDKSKGILEASAVMLFDLQAAGEVATKIKEASEIKSPKPKAHRLRASINHASTTPFGENKNTHTSHIASQKKLLASARAKALKRTALASLASQEPLARFLDWAESKKLNSMQVWRLLDRDMDMKLSRTEFMRGMKEVAYHGNSAALFNLLDRDQSSTVSFLHFAVEHALRLADFKRQVSKRFGSVAACFKQCDTDRNGTLSLEEFNTACLRLKFSCTADSLFALFDDPEDKGGRNGELSGHEVAFLDRWEVPEYLFGPADDAAADKLRNALNSRHGHNAIITWRKNFAEDGNMRLSHFEFMQACRRMKQTGITEASTPSGEIVIWRALDRNRSGWIGIRDWDQEAGNHLATFVLWAKDNFGRVASCLSHFKAKKEGIDQKEFRKGLKEKLGLDSQQLNYLFHGLCAQVSDGSALVTRAKLQALDSWDPIAEVEEAQVWGEIVAENLPSLLEEE